MSLVSKIDFYEIRTVFSLSQGKTIKRLILSLPGSGCEYQKKSGGCAMCGFHKATKKYSLGILYPFFLFKFLFDSSLKDALKKGVSEVFIFNGGSFLNNKEIPLRFQEYVLKRLNGISEIKTLLVESRCEYINEEKLEMIKNNSFNLKVFVAIGLESQDDFIRNKVIKKSLSKDVFEKTLLLLSHFEIKSAVYIFLKPKNLSEKEAYFDVLKSINYVLSKGVSEIFLSSAFVQEGTELEKDYLSGQFRPPYLWTVMLIIEEVLKNSWPLSVGGFSDEPPPIAIAKNCDLCSRESYEIVEKFRQTRIFLNNIKCSCQEEFFKEFI